MPFVRKVGRFLSASLLKLSLFVFATSMALGSVIGSPEPIKDSLDKSGIYDTVVPGFLDAASKEEGQEGREDLPVDDAKVKEIINSSFSPQFLKSSADTILEGFHSWLNGETAQPEFKVDLTGPKQSLVQGLAGYAEQRLLSLPACTSAQARELAGQDIDPFAVECRPPVVISQEKQKIIDELNNSEFLKDQEISSASLTKDNPDKFTEELKGLPDGYQLLLSLPMVTGILALVSAVGLILLHDDKRRGFRQAGIIVLVAGLFLLVSTLLFQVIYDKAANPNSFNIENASLKDAVIDLLGRLYSIFNRSLMIISAIYTMVGGGTLGILAYLNRNNKSEPRKQDGDAKPRSDANASTNGEKPAEPNDKK